MNIDDIFLWYLKRSFIFSHNFNYQFILVQHFHSPGSVDLRWPIAILVVCRCVSLIVSVHAITNTYLLLGIRESVVWVGLHLIRIMKLQYINFNLLQISSPKHLHVHDYSRVSLPKCYPSQFAILMWLLRPMGLLLLKNLLFCKTRVIVFKTISFFLKRIFFLFRNYSNNEL